jgi:hypothetical protein
MGRITIAIAMAVALLVPAAGATTYLVTPDGTGDFPTIQAAINAAVNGDLILLADGTFAGAGNCDLSVEGKTITVRSQNNNPYACTVDCQGGPSDPHRGIRFGAGGTGTVEGIGIRNGCMDAPGDCGGAILMGGSSPIIRNCVFIDNTASWAGGAVFGTSGGTFVVRDCVFEGNSAHFGGALETYAREVQVEDCVFRGNHGQWGGALAFASVHGWVRRCVFALNTVGSSEPGAAVSLSADDHDVDFESCQLVQNTGGSTLIAAANGPGTVRLRNCTFYQNCAQLPPEEGGATVQVGWEANAPNVSIENSILSFATVGQAVACVTGSPTISCSDIHGNAGGDWVGCIAAQGGIDRNFSLDPCFCDADNDDFTLWNYSPCAQVGCGTIGAWPVACWDAQDIADSDASQAAQQHTLNVSASPNPFSEITSIRLASPTPGAVRVLIFDLTGREVRSFVVDGTERGSALTWDGRDHAGRLVPAGVYWVRASQGDRKAAARVLVLR